jgi:hypothetical protein
LQTVHDQIDRMPLTLLQFGDALGEVEEFAIHPGAGEAILERLAKGIRSVALPAAQERSAELEARASPSVSHLRAERLDGPAAARAVLGAGARV